MLAKLRLMAAALLAAGGLLLAAAPAGAVQTTTWGLMAAPEGHGYRSSIAHQADGSVIHDAVIVFNRTAETITIHLYVLHTAHVPQGYVFGPPTGGLAAGTSVGTDYVTLGAHQQARVPVTVHMPKGVHATTLAGIGAESTAVKDGALNIQQQLVVLIKATPQGHAIPTVVKDIGIWGSGALAVLLMVGVLAERERRRARRGSGAMPMATAV